MNQTVTNKTTTEIITPKDNQEYENLANQYLQFAGIKMSPLNAKRFITKCVLNKLNPFTGDVYAYESGENLVSITSYAKYLQIADTCPGRCGEKFTEHYDQQGNLVAITCTVAKYIENAKQVINDFMTFTARMNEYNTNRGPWIKIPSVMLRKCAHVNALRQAYPNEFKDIPYTADELGDDIDTKTINSIKAKLNSEPVELEQKITKKPSKKQAVLKEPEPVVVEPEAMPPHTMPNANEVSEKYEIEFDNGIVEERPLHQATVEQLNMEQQTQVDPLANIPDRYKEAARRFINDPLTLEYFALMIPFSESVQMPVQLQNYFLQNFSIPLLQISHFYQFNLEQKQQILNDIKSILTNQQ